MTEQANTPHVKRGWPAGMRIAIATIGAVAGIAALWFGSAVFEPLAFALFIIALTAPFMLWLKPHVGKGVAMLLTLTLTLVVLILFFGIVSWGVLRVGNWGIAHLAQFQTLYVELQQSLAERGWPQDRLLPQSFDPRWIIGPFVAALEQFRLISGFALLVFVFVVLGLTELEGMGRRLAKIEAERPNLVIGRVARDVSAKFGLYMKVRLVISLVDAVLCYVFFRLIGLEEALAWALLVGTMNFIPFIGPLLVAIAIGLFAAVQYQSVGMVLLAVGGTTAINFVLGSYIEPLMAGSALKMSAVLVLFSVFFWAAIWGIPGAFIGVQIMIVLLAICAAVPSLNWIAELFAGDSGTMKG